MTPDGSIVVGYTVGVPSADGFRWTAAGGLERIGGVGAYAISRDGKTIVGSTRRDQYFREIAAIWEGGTKWRELGGVPGGRPDPLTGLLSTPYDVSGDGSVIVGLAYDENFKAVGFRWEEKTGMVNLGPFGLGSQQSALAVSADGKVVVGRDRDLNNSVTPAGYRGYVYFDGQMHPLHAFGWAGEARATNGVGSIIVGQGQPASTASSVTGGGTTYLYTAWDGRFQELGAVWPGMPGSNLEEYSSRPYRVSDDGSVVVGETGGAFTQFAMIWTAGTGMVYMHDYLTRSGVTAHQGWTLSGAYYVSPDGRLVAGFGTNPQGIPDSWIVTLR
jgi:probable HAF family extracellular repeat protein